MALAKHLYSVASTSGPIPYTSTDLPAPPFPVLSLLCPAQESTRVKRGKMALHRSRRPVLHHHRQTTAHARAQAAQWAHIQAPKGILR